MLMMSISGSSAARRRESWIRCSLAFCGSTCTSILKSLVLQFFATLAWPPASGLMYHVNVSPELAPAEQAASSPEAVSRATDAARPRRNPFMRPPSEKWPTSHVVLCVAVVKARGLAPPRTGDAGACGRRPRCEADCTVEVDMSDVHAPDDLPYEDSKQGAWADVLGTLAGVLLLVSSGFWLLQGLAAVADDEFYANGTEYLYKINVTAWGWFHVVMAVVTCVVSIGILMRRSWGQALGVVVVVVSMITN